MDGQITGENDERVGISVIDNNDVEHIIEMEFSGEIKYHDQDGYSDDPDNRTNEENEHVNQARRYAKYYVYLERDYDTVDPEWHPERINAVRTAVAALSGAEFEQFFGDLYQQLRSYHDSDTERVVGIPSDALGPEQVLYRKSIYLGLDPFDTELETDAKQLAAKHGLDITDANSLSELTTEDRARLDEFSRAIGDLAVEEDIDLSEGLQIDSVSSLHTTYKDANNRIRTSDAEDPFDREPEAAVEIPVTDPGTLEEFQEFVNYNLACQVRDSFVCMGLEPPERFQILGYSRLKTAELFKHLDIYPNYLDPENQEAFA